MRVKAACVRRNSVVVHVFTGPVVRSHEYDLPKKIRKLGLCAALSAKYAEGQLVIVDSLVTDGKTKALAQNFAKMGWDSVC